MMGMIVGCYCCTVCDVPGVVMSVVLATVVDGSCEVDGDCKTTLKSIQYNQFILYMYHTFNLTQ